VVDSAIYEAVLNMMESLVTDYDQRGFIRERTGAILPKVAPSNIYPTADGLVLIAANQDTVFRRLCLAMGEPGLADDPRYSTHQARGSSQRELDERIGTWSRELTTAAVLDILKQPETAVPSGLIYRAPDMLADPHFKARAAIIATPHPKFGELRMQNVAPKLSVTPGAIRAPAPELGQHNDEVYLDLLGMSADRYARLRAQKVI
jgi:crotonobetainyl-CoA:carnitine CoA-transferase CaiB-like acyl-CoA transferase